MSRRKRVETRENRMVKNSFVQVVQQFMSSSCQLQFLKIHLNPGRQHDHPLSVVMKHVGLNVIHVGGQKLLVEAL